MASYHPEVFILNFLLICTRLRHALGAWKLGFIDHALWESEMNHGMNGLQAFRQSFLLDP